MDRPCAQWFLGGRDARGVLDPNQEGHEETAGDNDRRDRIHRMYRSDSILILPLILSQ